MRALCLIRHSLVYRREAFIQGLRRAGYKVMDTLYDPQPQDVLVIWNRYGATHLEAKRFEKAGAKVIVCENGYLGKQWLDDTWIAMAIGHHCGAGTWREGGPERWDALNVPLCPYRTWGKELVILGQRGIGEEAIASPPRWAEDVRAKLGGRIRPHPGDGTPRVALDEDLANATAVATWHSGAALRALILGIPVWYGFPKWLASWAARPLTRFAIDPPNRDPALRLAMFRRLVWAQWRMDEIIAGEPFCWLLQGKEAGDERCSGDLGDRRVPDSAVASVLAVATQ